MTFPFMNFLIQHTPLFYLVQSIWRDEAFSILLSERSPLWFITRVFDPPLYYLFLHYWMKIFGEGEIAARSLSILGFTFSTVFVIFWAKKMYKKHWFSWFFPLFFALNPTVLYYAFEIRAYAWYTFFTVISFYAYLEGMWTLNIVAVVLGLYTHSYMLIVPFTQAIHYIITHWKKFTIKKPLTIIGDRFLQSLVIILLLFTPWLYQIYSKMDQLKHSWYFPVDAHLVRAVLGNLFLGYEGTPGYLWNFSTALSLLLFGTFIFSVTGQKTRKRNGFFFLMIFIPLIIILGISFIKPLYVNRYVIPVTVAEVFLIIFALERIKNVTVKKFIAAAALLFVLVFNMWYPTKHAKLDIRTTVAQVNALMGNREIILANSPLIFFESLYYSNDRSRVYLYNPQKYPFPWYVGGIIVSPEQIVADYPSYPIRAFVIQADGAYEIKYNMYVPSGPTVISK
jgi:mannosyltransferase